MRVPDAGSIVIPASMSFAALGELGVGISDHLSHYFPRLAGSLLQLLLVIRRVVDGVRAVVPVRS